MKVRTNMDDIEVPETIASELVEWDDIAFAIDGYVYNYLDNSDGIIIDKEIAEFLRDYHTSMIPSEGGYPTDETFTFEDNGMKYTILAFGWLNEKNDRLYMIGFKEAK